MSDFLADLKLPGFVWVAVLVVVVGALHLFAENALWYDAALVLLAGMAKAVNVNFERVQEIVDEFDGPQARSVVVVPAPQKSPAHRWFWG